ncbi:hypothetical protein LINPERPRIM_LOCUS42115 [Linum perenne]
MLGAGARADSARAGAEAGAAPPIRFGDVASSDGDCTEPDDEEEVGDSESGEGEGDSSGDGLGERHRGFPSLLHQWGLFSLFLKRSSRFGLPET